ncbi:2-succinyl-5-enolpyruvyl-6-hydroxy-3-cyclohexene-1-carboxylic-acid synthase [Jeotgalibacillus haloalkalitolerans]|uniref:2-succinyl-5-enolpyruvyl-6-hydroxy-3-cyclohexene-1-carboxylate synthase n=1 Tax=Jeotgalibacillus haloalkalitolerans TaxID=3104292 RepID=A0ABU5KN48_9BACL|nr:2-succinyl-5-enolpyruvyl-6-hydroxy-3-cyclohexene-1-carboxylic-acid synthase [Jeotgalibacillus sp. HH7-29]MDZ5712562.1 2-succinyl-5-enolpyruvyl-6-hydroxy-3-cyclohexene-1-carboxylic-acid synthase [Jeotgalibacillus sp. HH7-29]
MSHKENLTAYVSSFIEQLYQSGVKRAVISPGSRSTPLAYLLKNHPGIQTHVNVDERSAAFYALGMAKASQEPVAIVCTSGTAAANYYPAVVEARYARVPLIVLTADRPHELRDNGAPQAIDQINLFGKHAKWFYDMPIPESEPDMLLYTGRIAAKAAAKSSAAPKGPVHLNFPFREPLSPDLSFTPDSKPLSSVYLAEKQLSEHQLSDLIQQLHQAEKGLIIAGPSEDQTAADAIIHLAEATGFPVLADPLSGLRSLMEHHPSVIECYDAFLRDNEVKQLLQADLIIRFGGMPVSKALTQYVKGSACSQWLIDEGADWRDPTSSATHYIEMNDQLFAEQLAKADIEKSERSWLNRWISLNEKAAHQIRQYTDRETDEGAAVGTLLRSLPEGAHLLVGNSMPVRDVDTFWIRGMNPFHVWANRGANGIDGVVSTALGIASVKREPVYLLIGDLSMFHDLNGLLVTKQHPSQLQIVVMNNNGGGIFSFLPQASEPEHFETLFGTPPSLDFRHAAALYDMNYERCETKEALQQSLSGDNHSLKLTEVITDREKNTASHRLLWETVAGAVRGE